MKARPCANCGHTPVAHFENETFHITHGPLSVDVKGLAGWRCPSCGEVEFEAKSARRYAAAGDSLVIQAREVERAEIRRIRRKLGLSQATAAKLTGGGHNAFSRYERGEAAPLPAVVNLFKLLDKHPDLLKEINQ
jgi:HTH-type transcriptional regulator/antitoxin MqsA